MLEFWNVGAKVLDRLEWWTRLVKGGEGVNAACVLVCILHKTQHRIPKLTNFIDIFCFAITKGDYYLLLLKEKVLDVKHWKLLLASASKPALNTGT